MLSAGATYAHARAVVDPQPVARDAVRVAAGMEVVATTADTDGTFEQARQCVIVMFGGHCPFP
ncbi:hypothetical protein A8E30_05910 [Burkholderia cenocepacia]|nr:hypothetical protein A8E30_05910 [Burkholderia cenocepacia]ONS85303.1 hypothetical protein A8E31_14415 [Burkholderia cenocepacia]